MQYLCSVSKTIEWSWFISKQATQHHSNPSLCPNHWCRRSWSWPVLWIPTRPSRTNTNKRYPFHYRGLEYQSRKSRGTWSNRQIWPWSTKWSRSKANRIFPRECSGHSKHSLPTREDSTQGHHQMVNTKIRLIIFFAVKDGKALYSQLQQDWELTGAHVMNSLLQNSDLNWRKKGKPLDYSTIT